MKPLHLLVVPLERRGRKACGHKERRIPDKEIQTEGSDPLTELKREEIDSILLETRGEKTKSYLHLGAK